MRPPGKTVALLLVIATFAIGYLVFRYFYQISGDFPFSQELILVFIGAVATVLITALLLNQQTELELKKEAQVLLMQQKTDVYFALIDHIGDIVENNRMDSAALNDLRILNHKLAMIGSPEVIGNFNSVLDALERASRDDSIAGAERNEIMHRVAQLTFYIRQDLLGTTGSEDGDAQLLEDIIANNRDLQDGDA